MTSSRVLVTGAGGFIGHHLVRFLKAEGHWVRGVDLKLPEYEASAADEFELLDLRRWDACLQATRGVDDGAGGDGRSLPGGPAVQSLDSGRHENGFSRPPQLIGRRRTASRGDRKTAPG